MKPEKLVDAIYENDMLRVVELLRKLGNINKRYFHHQTPLHTALMCNNTEIIMLLLAMGADVNITYEKNDTALHLAARYTGIEIAKLLIKKGASVNAMNDLGQTALYFALMNKKKDLITFFLDNGADLNLTCENSDSMLHLATRYTDVETVSLLIHKEANINTRNCKDQTPLHYAVLYKKRNIVMLLLDLGVDVSAMDCAQNTPLHLVSQGGFSLEDDENTVFNSLIKKGASVNARNSFGETPFHLAFMYNRENLIAISLSSGADINLGDNNNTTPLHLAVRSGILRFVNFLLEKGAHVNARNNMGRTPLHEAVNMVLPNAKSLFTICAVIQELLNWGASVPVTDTKGYYSPLDMLLERYNPRIVEVFEKHTIKLKILRLPSFPGIELNFKNKHLFISSCRSELEKLRSTKYGIHSLHDVFSKYHNPNFTFNEEMDKAISSPTLTQEFPLYGTPLKAWLRKAKLRFGLLNKAQFILKSPLPVEIVREILSYVDNDDLLNVIKVYE